MRFYRLLLVTLVLSACASLPSVIGPFPDESAPVPADSGILADIDDAIARYTQNSLTTGTSGFWRKAVVCDQSILTTA